MHRRFFLSLLGAGATAPLLPIGASATAATASYSRTIYGMAKFHAQTRTGLTAADLAGRLKISMATAEGLMGELTAKGVLRPILQSAALRVGAAKPTATRAEPALRKLATRALDEMNHLTAEDAPQGTGPAEDTETKNG